MWGKSSLHAIGRRMLFGLSVSYALPIKMIDLQRHIVPQQYLTNLLLPEGTPPNEIPSPRATVAITDGSASNSGTRTHILVLGLGSKDLFTMRIDCKKELAVYKSLPISERAGYFCSKDT